MKPLSSLVGSVRAELTDHDQVSAEADLSEYQWDPHRYIREKLGWTPWRGTPEMPGQAEVLDAYLLALQQQHEKVRFDAGEITEAQLQYWKPGQTIQNWLRIEAGHTVGKTKLSSGILNHFFDCFVPSIGYAFAPKEDQIRDLLWKEVASDRAGKGLPGKVNDLEMKRAADHFAKGRATSNAHGKGTEGVQGQHGRYLIFVLDEAEGIADFVWPAVRSMTSGGISIVLMLANPRTRTSQFHKQRENPKVKNFRISCVSHPNVRLGREVVPGAVQRDYVDGYLDSEHVETVSQHDEDAHTFEVPWRPGKIFKPDAEVLFRVLGIAPANISSNTFVPAGRFEAAQSRGPLKEDLKRARLGLDVARYGDDFGTLYVRHAGRVWRSAQMSKLDTNEYARIVKAEALRLKSLGVTSLHVRVDGGGGFGGGVIDQLKVDDELLRGFADFLTVEVHFGGSPSDASAYADLATEMYGEAAESLKGLQLVQPPPLLESDLCDRPYTWVNKSGVSVKRLTPKDDFKKRHGRSPDDGDGFVLAAAPDHIFGPGELYFA